MAVHEIWRTFKQSDYYRLLTDVEKGTADNVAEIHKGYVRFGDAFKQRVEKTCLTPKGGG